MRPSSRLPSHIVLSLAAVATACVLALVAWPGGVLALLATATLVALLGAWSVARRASRNRSRESPTAWMLLPSGPVRRASVPADLPWAVAVFGTTAVVMAALAAPGLYVKDGGELVAAVRGLGVPHPTGFAAFCMVGKAFDLLPLGGGAFRLNLLSVASIAAAAALAFLLASELGRFAAGGRDSTASRLGALVAAVGLPASHLAWLHGTTAEVYAPSLAGTAAAVVAWTFGATRRDARWLAVGALLTGLGLGGHVTWPLVSGLVGGVATTAFVRTTRRWQALPILAAATLAGSAVVLYLPAVASRGPYMNWGDPSDAGALAAHLTGARIRQAFADEIGGVRWAVLGVNLVRSLKVLADGSLALVPAALPGLVLLGVRRPAVGVTAGVLVAVDLLFSAQVNPMGIVDLQTLLPATLFVAVLAGAGVVIVARRSPRIGLPVALAALALAAWQGGVAPADRDMARVVGPADALGGFLDELAPGAVVFGSSDNLSAGLAGLQVIEGARPDVLVLVKQHLGDTGYVTARLAFHGGFPGELGLASAVRDRPFEAASESPEAAVARAVHLALARGPVRFELGEGRVDRGLYPNLVPEFPAFTISSSVSGSPDAERLLAARDRALAMAEAGDRWTAQWSGTFLRTAGAWASALGDDGLARALTADAVRVSPDDARGHYNLGVLLRAGGDEAAALRRFRQAVAIDPGYARAWVALMEVAESLGLEDEAAQARDRGAALGRAMR